MGKADLGLRPIRPALHQPLAPDLVPNGRPGLDQPDLEARPEKPRKAPRPQNRPYHTGFGALARQIWNFFRP